MNLQKEFGLIKLTKQKHNKLSFTKPSIFDSDDEAGNSEPSSSSSKRIEPNLVTTKKQTQIDYARALEEDPNVFKYDDIYEDIKQQNVSKHTPQKSVEKKKEPKYMHKLIEHSKLRNKEYERRNERKIQKERENEGDEYRDKEQFVTAAYVQKLKEMREDEEREKRQIQIEDLLDVTKQKDLTGFYRNLLNNTVSNSTNSVQPNSVESNSVEPNLQNNQNDNLNVNEENVSKQFTNAKKQRHLRVRKHSSSSSSSNESLNQTDDHLKTIESNDNDDSQIHDEKEIESEILRDQNDNRTEIPSDLNQKKRLRNNDSDAHEDNESETNINETDVKGKRPKIDKMANLIQKFTKRTIGEVFEEAKNRYFERKRNKLTRI